MRAELADRESSLLVKERELLERDQTLLVLQEEVRCCGARVPPGVGATSCARHVL
jgi:hypothetical protein